MEYNRAKEGNATITKMKDGTIVQTISIKVP